MPEHELNVSRRQIVLVDVLDVSLGSVVPNDAQEVHDNTPMTVFPRTDLDSTRSSTQWRQGHARALEVDVVVEERARSRSARTPR
jgi:hypothetical protein